MSVPFDWEPDDLRRELEALGYEVDGARAHTDGGGSLTARRDRGDQSHLLVIDSGGRFRASVTATLDDQSTPAVVAGLSLRIVTTSQHISTISARAPDIRTLLQVVAALGDLSLPEPKPAAIAPPPAAAQPAVETCPAEPTWTDAPPPP